MPALSPMPTAPNAPSKQDFLALLRIPTANEKKIDTYLQARLIGLGHGQHCSRCGGSGSYSFNAVDGSRCYGCGGSGYVAQALTAELFTEVEADVREGRLDTYLTELQAKQETKRQAATAYKRVMAAWQAATDQFPYRWQDAADGKQPAKDMSKEFNRPMHDAYQKVSKLSIELETLPLRRKHVKSAEESKALDAKIEQTRTELLAATETALQVIEDALTRAPAILARHATPAPRQPDDSPSP